MGQQKRGEGKSTLYHGFKLMTRFLKAWSYISCLRKKKWPLFETYIGEKKLNTETRFSVNNNRDKVIRIICAMLT